MGVELNVCKVLSSSRCKSLNIRPAASDKRIPESKIMATNHLISSSRDRHSVFILAMLDAVMAWRFLVLLSEGK